MRSLYQGITQSFDEAEVKVIFTSEGETADSYIERTVSEMNMRLVQVSVATSDLAEQWLIFQKEPCVNQLEIFIRN